MLLKGDLSVGSKVNVERALKAGQRFDGHNVQGHVDTTITLLNVQQDPPNSLIFTFKVPDASLTPENIDYLTYIIPKGYVCLDGTSLTVIAVDKIQRTFSVMLIKYTQERVILPLKVKGDRINLEVDQMGKYIESVVLNTLLGDTERPTVEQGGSLLVSLIHSIVDAKLNASK
jgi:riboflavin synthase